VPVSAAFAKIGKLGIDFYRRGIRVQTGGDNDMPGWAVFDEMMIG
jgi:hypothetical protein